MIAACYTMDLYCENEEYHDYMEARGIDEVSEGERYGGFAQYVGETWTGCLRQAKNMGGE